MDEQIIYKLFAYSVYLQGTRQDKATLKREGKKRLDHEYRRQKAIMTKDAQRAGVEVLPLMESFGAFAQKQQSKGKK